MKKTLIFSLVILTLLFNGCSNQERVTLGAIAGASSGALATDTSNKYMYGYGYPRYSGYGAYSPGPQYGVIKGPYGY